MTLQEFAEVLRKVTDKVYHFKADDGVAGQYIIWQEMGGTALYGSGTRLAVVKEVQAELYTAEEFDPMLDELLKVFEENDIVFEEPVTAYEKEVGYIRHLIKCQIL